ncbi:hypothetical protein BH10ACT3_BH10ACT3_14370 [soil metagenome]
MDDTPTPSRRTRTKKSWGEKSRRERGVVLVWFALMLTVLLGFAGFAVDLSNWWFQAERLQKAADAGAHAGVVFLPADLTGATSTARNEVQKNGYKTTGLGSNGTLVVTQEPNPNRLRVRVTTKVPSFFVGLLGVNDVTLTREAVAEYISPVPMGSPENKLGNDPEQNQVSAQFWMNIAGPKSTKASGDRYQAKTCGSSVAGCNTSNDEYNAEGYTFALKVTNVPSNQPLNVQIYDPAMVYVNDTCGANLPSAAERTTLVGFGNRTGVGGLNYADANDRYAGGVTKWCTGDQDIEGRGNRTTYLVRAPDATPWSDTDNPVLCSTTMPSFNPGVNGEPTIFQYLNPTDGIQDNEALVNPSDNVWTFAEVFRRNVNICSIPSSTLASLPQGGKGDFILQIRTNADPPPADPKTYNPARNDGGHNRFSVQAGFGTAGLVALNGNDVSINARGRMSLYANADGADTRFYLARVLPYDAGRTLRVTLFDMGDASAPGTLQILPPAEYASSFSGCSFSKDDGGGMSTNASTCTITNVSSNTGFQGRSVNIDIPIPANYTCTQTALTGCWIKVRADFDSGVTDTTTWSAAILGNPIRLVE